jgi:2'-5' RNA ligase
MTRSDGDSAVATKREWRFVNRRSLFQQFSAMAMCEEIITYWLCPAERERNEFAELIAGLAWRFDAPVFEPHATIHVTSASRENPLHVLEEVVSRYKTFQLGVRGLNYSDKYTKTLFVELAPDAELAHLSEDLRRASVSPSDYELNPHVSLLYKEIDEETKRTLAAFTLPFTEVNFSSVKAVVCPAKIESREDVEAWRVVAECSLME